MQNRASLLQGSLTRYLGWIMLGLCALLGLLGAGSIILRLLNRRYRDLAVYIACGAFAGLCLIAPVYLSARKASRFRDFLGRTLLWLLISALIWCLCTGFFLWNYHGEVINDAWYAPMDTIVFSDGFLIRTHIVAYAPGNALWTGPVLPKYEYID